MKVTNNSTNATEHTRGTEKLQSTSHSRKKTGAYSKDSEIESSDKVNISSHAKEAARAKSIAKGAPDVDEEKVARLKAAIHNGSYKVDSDAVASRMVDEHLDSSF